MTTVTAKELRENLSQYLDRMAAGEEISIIRRSEIIGTLAPEKASSSYNGAVIAAKLEKLLPELKKSKHFSDPHKTYRQLRDEMYENDPKYRKYLTAKPVRKAK